MHTEFLISWGRRIAVVLSIALLAACASTTKSGQVGVQRKQLLLVSAQEVDQMAAKAYRAELIKAQKAKALNTNAPVVRRVRAIAQRLIPQVAAFRSDALQWQWEVNVIDSKALNAWCMQGGRMAIYTGLIETLQLNDDELAAILGHEMAHALREHSREQISHAVATQLGVNIGASLLGLSALGGDLVSKGAQIMWTLPNSRSAEQEADRMGVELAARAGYDPRAAVSVWKKMAAQTQGARQPEWLSTHPSPAKRTQDLSRYAQQVMPLYQKAQGKS